MIKIRRCELLAGIALSCGMFFASTCFGQVIVGNDVSSAAPQHLGSGPIDRNNLSADILNCQVCRQRLGLPPFQVSSSTVPRASTARMLGTPGMISCVTAEQMALQGFVVEELKPPQTEPGAIPLGELPPEVRQQFMRSLELPFGARVMSAEIRGQKPGTVKVEGSESVPPAEPITSAPTQSDSASELIQLQQTKEQLQKQLVEQAADLAKKQIVAEEVAAQEKNKAMNLERELAKERENSKVQLEQMQFEWQKRIEQADAANKEVLTLLEKRTAEVTELRSQLKSQQEAMSKAKQESPSKDKPDSKRKAPNKGKKPDKPSIET